MNKRTNLLCLFYKCSAKPERDYFLSMYFFQNNFDPGTINYALNQVISSPGALVLYQHTEL